MTGHGAPVPYRCDQMSSRAPKIICAVKATVDWFETARLKGIKVIEVPDPHAARVLDKRVVEDLSAPPMWARFYDIPSGRPIFCDRDGVPKANLSDFGYERRNGYSWLDYWPQSLLEKEYPTWAAKWGTK